MADRRIGRSGRQTNPAATAPPLSGIRRPSDATAVEIAYGRPATLKVFVSSVMRGGPLDAERQLVADVIDRHPDAEPWLWERNASAGPYSSAEVCKGNASTSDVLLLIVSDDITDITEAEWRAAQSAGAACIMLRKAGSKPSARLRAFIEIERSKGIDVSFSDLESLRSACSDAIRRSLTDAVRYRVRNRRIGSSDTPLLYVLEAGIDRVEDEYWTGSAQLASLILDELDVLISSDGRRPEDLELVAGLVQGATGRPLQAIATYERIIRDEVSSDHAIAVAHQNLGLELLRARDFKRSREEMRHAYERHQRNGNWFGVLQVVLNRAALALDTGELDVAATLADTAEMLLEGFDAPLPQRWSVVGLRGHLAAAAGDFDEALTLFKRAYHGGRRDGDRDGACVGAQNVAAAYRDLDRLGLASRWANRALARSRDTGSLWRQLEIRRFLGVLAMDWGKLNEAVEQFEIARALALSSQDVWLAATFQADIGALRVELGDPGSRRDLEAAYLSLAEFNDTNWLQRIDLNRSILSAREADYLAAAAYLSNIASDPDADVALRAECYERTAALVLEDSRDGHEALRLFHAALQCSREEPPEMAMRAALCASQLEESGCLKQALQLFDDALSHAADSGNVVVLCDVTNDWALLVAELDDLDTARSAFGKCLSWAESIGDNTRRGRTLQNLAEILLRQGELSDATQVLVEALELGSEMDDRDAIRSVTAGLARVENMAGRPAATKVLAHQLLSDSDAANDDALAAEALGLLGGASFLEEDYVEAATWYRKASRRNRAWPARHLEDLQGISESHSAARRWRPTTRAVQNVVTFAQSHGLQGSAWHSLLRSARWYLDRGETRRAAEIAFPAWVLASQVPSNLGLLADGKVVSGEDAGEKDDEDTADSVIGSQLFEALVTSALHELWSEQSSAYDLYRHVMESAEPEIGAEAGRALGGPARGSGRPPVAVLQTLIDQAREYASSMAEDD